MKISLQKQQDKPSVLHCTRADGSITWAKMHPGTETHDLAHYAVESVLEFKDAFYGLLMQGYEISDFELPKGVRPAALEPANLPTAALQTEHLVNLLQVHLFNSVGETPLIEQFRTILESDQIPFPMELTPESLTKIQRVFQDLVMQWKQLPVGTSLELYFEPA